MVRHTFSNLQSHYNDCNQQIVFFLEDRMKPDLVAPGYKILAPRAHAQANSYDETYETFGTSFSAPVVSGNAALARQYFEEGWFPCGVKGCNKKRIKPSGSLLKAILMNGAIQTISHVQKVPAGIIMEQVKEYDNNAGMLMLHFTHDIAETYSNTFLSTSILL